MAKKTVRKQPRRGKKAARKTATPAVPPLTAFECKAITDARRDGPQFTLAQIARLFGGTYGGDFDPVLTVAINALDDVRRTVRVCIEAMPHQGDDSPIDPVRELLEQVWERTEAGCDILNRCRVPSLQGGAS